MFAPISRRTFLATTATLPSLVALPAATRADALVVTTNTLQPRRRLTANATDGVRIAIQEWGDPNGPELLLVHGGMQSHLCWQQQLTGALDHCRIVTFDLRGHGESDKPSDAAAYSKPRQWGDDLAAVIKTAALRRPVVAAWSFGGIVLTNYLLAYGDAQLSGINFVGAITDLAPALRATDTSKVVMGLFDPSLAVRIDAIRAFVRACFEKQPPQADYERILVYNAQVSPAFVPGSTSMKMKGVDAMLRKLTRPVLVTQGEVDRAVPIEAARYIAERAPGATLALYPGVGHSPFYEAPERFNRELLSLAQRAATA